MTQSTEAGLDPAQAARTRGALITIAGVAVLSTDALLVRLIEGDAFTVAFWRGALMAVGFWVLYAVQTRSAGLRGVLRPSGPTLLAAVLFAGSTLCFVGAIKATAVANALLIVATVPLSGALISWLVLRERVARRTWFAIGGALLGLLIIVANDLSGGGLRGNLLAIAVTLFLGGYFTVLRSGRVANALPALILSGVLSAAIAALVADGLAVPSHSVPYVLLLGLIVMPVSFALISIGPRSLPTAEVGLIMLLETVLGTALAWLVLGEVPATSAFVGGSIVILSLLGRALVELRNG